MVTVRLLMASAIVFSAAVSGVATAQQMASTGAVDAWAWRATLYAWFPSVHSTDNFDVGGGGSISTDTSPGSYLSNLQFAAMGTLEARRAPWSFVADAIYLNFGDLKSNVRSVEGSTGPVVPATVNVRTDLEGFAGALLGGYALMQTPSSSLDVVVGARYLRIKTRLDWEFTGPIGAIPAQGDTAVTKDIWDGVVGLRGTAQLSGNWYVPYYADIGAGSSSFTWQAFAGVGYRLTWGDVTVGYRHLSYDFHNDRPLDRLAFSGPIVGVAFKF